MVYQESHICATFQRLVARRYIIYYIIGWIAVVFVGCSGAGGGCYVDDTIKALESLMLVIVGFGAGSWVFGREANW